MTFAEAPILGGEPIKAKNLDANGFKQGTRILDFSLDFCNKGKPEIRLLN